MPPTTSAPTPTPSSPTAGSIRGEIDARCTPGGSTLCTGKALCPPVTDDLKTYPVRLVGDEIQVKLNFKQ